MEIKMIKVVSSNVAEIGYDIDTFTLKIKFNYGGIYQYKNVPLAIFEGLKLAESKGKYVNQNIVNKYSFTKIA
jgi:hypothetical protein